MYSLCAAPVKPCFGVSGSVGATDLPGGSPSMQRNAPAAAAEPQEGSWAPQAAGSGATTAPLQAPPAS